jgi:UPF0271 protein
LAINAVLDAGAFYSGTPFLSSGTKYFTTEDVLNEVKHIKSQYGVMDLLLGSGNLQVMNPDKEYIEEVKVAAKKTGDLGTLSNADVSIIALALQLRTTLVTDDYAASNVSTVLGISVVAATLGKGIRETRRWVSYCSACSRTFDPEFRECPRCGNRLKRKFRRHKV